MTLYKRKNKEGGIWWTRFQKDRQTVNRSTSTSNKKLAKQIEEALKDNITMERFGLRAPGTDGAAMTFSKAVADFLAEQERRLDKPETFNNLKAQCQPLLNVFGEKEVARIEPTDVDEFRNYRQKQVSVRTKEFITGDTVNAEIAVLKRVFQRLVTKRLLLENPAENVKLCRKNNPTFHLVEDEEQNLFLLAAPQPLQDIADLMLETGMRPREIFMLERYQVEILEDWQEDYKDDGVTGNFLVVEGSKTESSDRVILLSPKASEILERRLRTFSGSNLFPHLDNDDLKPISQMTAEELMVQMHRITNRVGRQHRAVLKKLGLDFRLYDMRHTYASIVQEVTKDPRKTADALGHKGIELVTRYSHVSDEARRAILTMRHERKKSREVKRKRIA